MNEPQQKPRGRPKAEPTKVRIGIRVSPEVIEFFRADGAGWQTRVDDVLRAYVRRRSKDARTKGSLK
ncbi:BrnA antitoxin family protein [Paraburkholderia saeva]|uniref:BrnA antitoxin family protein n=1 Tax=Paraburkholderia saeva TaxID=2777537 RepID=UPI001E570844|nr:BrnA antitoxin family protein [Paraburkholderia saeva]